MPSILADAATAVPAHLRLRRALRLVVTACILAGLAVASCSSPDPGQPVTAGGEVRSASESPRPAPTAAMRIVLPTADPSAPAPSATFANYYGTVTVDGAAAQDGLVVEVFTPGGVLVGKSATTQGWYPYTRVFGAGAESNPPATGAAVGEELVFKVGGRQASAGPAPVKWKNEPAPERVDLTVSR